jgi:Predicted membrane protein
MQERVRSAGELAFIGVIIQLAGLLLGGLATLAGYIVELIAIKRLSEAFNNPAIWRNALNAVIIAIVGTVVLIASTFAFLFGLPLLLKPMNSYLYTSLYIGNPSLYPLLFIGIVAAIFVVVYVFVLLLGRYYRNLYNELANSSGVSEFRDAAKWTWLGALLFVVIVGAILVLVGRIFALLGYNRLKEWKPPQQT